MEGQPTRIGKYDVIREIGRGGMGKVYSATDQTIGRMVAIKQVTAVVSDDPDLLKRFYREAQSTGKLQHPNIVTLYDLGEQDGVPYLVMEYLEGDSLEKIIQERRHYTVAEKLSIVIQVCEGLAYAHQRTIIHRDIKPGNIVVLNDGGVKIVDFGIAQFGNERYTRTGYVVGSLYYMSPEQLQDAGIDARSDIYSTGIVLYEFLTGSVPFRGKDPASTLAKILHDSPAQLSNLGGSYSADLDAVIRRALAKDRNARYTSMDDLTFDLRSLQEKLSRELIETSLGSAESLMGSGQWDKAREQLRQVLKLDKQHRRANELLREVQTQIQGQQIREQVQQLRLRAEEALGLRNWEEAIVSLDEAIKIDNSNTELIQFRDSVHRSAALLTGALRRAESAHNAGDLEGAIRAVEEALAVDPYNTTAKALIAILSKEISERTKWKKIEDFVAGARKEIAMRHFTAALELLHGAEMIDASVPEVQQLIRSATAGREHEKRRVALEKACSEIEDLLNRDEYSAACAKVDEALLSFPQDLGLLKLKGFAERQREAWTRRQFIESRNASARQLADSGDLVRAQQILTEALEHYPDDAGVISLLGAITDEIARHEAQRREVERQANERRRYLRIQLEAAAELQQVGQTAQALKKVQEGLVGYPDSEELRSRAAELEETLAREETLRKRAEEESRLKRAEVEKAIAESWQLLSSQQTGQAVTMLGEALRRHPDSAALRSQLEFAQRRLAVSQAERERVGQEARRRLGEIQKEVATAQRLMDARQTAEAFAALERALARYPESGELKSLVQVAHSRLAAERAERESAEKELRQKRVAIENEILAARELLDAKRTADSLARLELAFGRYPDSAELKGALAHARQRLAAEEAAREKAKEDERRKLAEIQGAILSEQQFMDAGQLSRGVAALELASQRYPESSELKAHLEQARQRLAVEEAEREHAAQVARCKQEEAKKEIAAATRLLESGQTVEAVASLERALRRLPDSEELKTQLNRAKGRVAEEEAPKRRLEEEKRQRQAEIASAIEGAGRLLASNQTSRAVSTLENALRSYPESGEIRASLEAARNRMAAELAERDRVEREAQERRDRIATEVENARRLLKEGQTSKAVTALEAVVANYQESEQLRGLLAAAKEQQGREIAEREKAEKRRVQVQAEAAKVKDLLERGDPEEAFNTGEAALRVLGKDRQLLELLETAKAAVKQKKAEEKRCAAEHQQAEERKHQRYGHLADLRKLAVSTAAGLKQSALEKLLGRAREIAARYPGDAEIQQSYSDTRTALESALASRREASSETEARSAALPKFLNRWTAIAVVGVIALGIAVKYFSSKTPLPPSTFTVNVETQPAGATIQVGNQTCVTPNCRLNLSSGEYQIDARLQGYRPLSQDLVVSAREPLAPVKLILVPEPPAKTAGYLRVSAGIEGADVLINGSKYSQTPFGGTVRLPLDPGEFTVEVHKKGYALSKSLHVEVRKGQDTTAEFTLLPLPTASQLVITGAMPNLQVRADGHYLGLTGADGSFSQSVEAGDHEIVLVQDNRRSNVIHKNFAAGQRTTVEGKQFTIAPSSRSLAAVVITNLPSTAVVKAEGAIYQPDASGTARFEIAAGEHTLEITANGYKPREIQQSFPPGNVPLVGSLERLDLEAPEWAKVESSSDMAALQGFLNEFPKGNHAQQAQPRLDKLIAGSGSEQELLAFAAKFPNTPAGDAAKKRVEGMRAEAGKKEQDRQAINGLLQQYRAAYENLDFKALTDLYPELSPSARKATQTKFKNAVSVKVVLNSEIPILNGDQASIKVTQTLNWSQKDKSQSSEMTPALTWQLVKKDGHWLVQKGP